MTRKIAICGVSLDHSEKWIGTYRGVRFEVFRRAAFEDPYYPREREYDWCHYLFVNEQQFAPEDLPKWIPPTKDYTVVPEHPRTGFDYYASPWAGLDWHSYITHFEIRGHKDGHRVLEPGCDYQHSWDSGIEYSLQGVTNEAKQTIDSLWDAYPNLRVACWWMGTYHPLSEMEEHKGRWISPKGKAQRDKHTKGVREDA